MAQTLLSERGHEIVTYPSVDAFRADSAGIAASDVILTMPDMPVRIQEMDLAPRLRAVVSMVTGTENIAETEATRRGILVANGHVVESYVSMAEATVMLILASLYDLDRSQAQLREPTSANIERRARMLRRKTIGLIGFGRIAQTVAQLLAPWQVELLTFMRHPRGVPAYVRSLPLDEVLAQSDVVVILTNLDDSTRGLIDETRLRRMKEDAVLVNTARGAIIDEAALVRVAQERPNMRIALDVFEALPLAPDHPLRALPNAILTPHVVGHTSETTVALGDALLENVERILCGELPLHVCNPSVIETWLARWGARP
ncbi:NAD(P)-dependent oxidoreductase [Microvirga alba]|nr:NAD(P)-dependent oxidoreductase [Microvirga alba]